MKSFSLQVFFATILISFLTMGTALAAPACTLPVCNISDKIAELRLVTGEERAAFYTNLTAKYKASRDQATLSNLIEFCIESYKLSLELDISEEWIPTLAADLLNRSLDYALAQGPIVGTVYGRWYGLFIGDSASAHRFQNLLFWQNQLKHTRLTTASEFKQLIAYMKLAVAASVSLNDEDYVANLAQITSTEAGIQLLRLAPYMEGVYSIQVSCQNIDAALCPKIDKFSLILGDDWRGIQAAFIASELENPVFEFNEVKLIDENTVHAETGPLDVPIAPGSMHLVFDHVKNTFTGVIKTPRTRIEVQVTGKRIVSTDELYQMAQPTPLISIDQVEGYYRGRIQASAANWADRIIPEITDFNLTLARFADNSFKATMRGDNSTTILYDFPAAYYFKNLGVITSYTADKYGLLKITYAYRLVNGMPKWVGFAQSLRTGQYYFLQLEPK
ncbi:MAG: hypothetical protein H7328_02020 [Bdellovibrio sp.]|nr:hypothetical protein [Bdellovibrio sp.]